MIDLEQFADRFRARLITIAGESRGILAVDAYRLYVTDATFHAHVETIVMTAVHTIQNLGSPSALEPLQDQFQDEVERLTNSPFDL